MGPVSSAFDGERMNPILKWIVIVLVCVAAVFVIMPMLASSPRTGSKEYARIWRDRLLVCQSLEDVRNSFTCFEVNKTPEGRIEYIPEEEPTEDRPFALIESFSDGKWIACVHSCTHSHHQVPGGGTVVSKDSDGRVRVFLGHICDRLHATGETLPEFYSSLEKSYTIKEIKLK